MRSSAIITGVGLVTALGDHVDATWQALLAGRCIRAHTRVQPTGVAANSRVAGLAVAAARRALADARWSLTDADADDTAVVVATSKGPIEQWCDRPAATSDNPLSAGRCNFGLAAVADELVAQLGLDGCRRLTVSAACASGLIALARGVMMLQMGEVSRVLVVAAEASVHPLFVGSFRRLGVLVDEGQLCRPFDRHRSGFLMSEAAAAVCLERSERAEIEHRPSHRPCVAVDGFCLAGEATHLVAGDSTGRTLEHALTQLSGRRPPDLLHAHATGTQRADAIELAAIERVLSVHPSPRPPILYSHKGALGHSMGAAGLVAAVINYQCHLHQRVPPNVNTASPLSTARSRISSAVSEAPIRRSIACAAGFGGPVAMVGMSSV